MKIGALRCTKINAMPCSCWLSFTVCEVSKLPFWTMLLVIRVCYKWMPLQGPAICFVTRALLTVTHIRTLPHLRLARSDRCQVLDVLYCHSFADFVGRDGCYPETTQPINFLSIHTSISSIRLRLSDDENKCTYISKKVIDVWPCFLFLSNLCPWVY